MLLGSKSDLKDFYTFSFFDETGLLLSAVNFWYEQKGEVARFWFQFNLDAMDCICVVMVSPGSAEYHDNIMMSRCDSLGPLLAAISSFNRIFYASVT